MLKNLILILLSINLIVFEGRLTKKSPIVSTTGLFIKNLFYKLILFKEDFVNPVNEDFYYADKLFFIKLLITNHLAKKIVSKK